MNSATQVLSIDGPAGAIDVAIDRPSGQASAIALIAHPHPLFGGTRDNKVVQTLARALVRSGHICWRPNFRGVGDSDGSHDEGLGETDDLLAVVEAAREDAAAAGLGSVDPLLAGFSFGAFVQSRVCAALGARGEPPGPVALIAPAVSRFDVVAIPANSLVVHGESDDVVPLAAVLDWARPQSLPILVIPGADHFFHRRLPLLTRIVLAWLAGRAAGSQDD
ncbi:MAG: alpha/beta hydrolase [Burkholderiaceae bacterium]|nr:alpha/beta hydrolase [Burkholderiaceae bacterium]